MQIFTGLNHSYAITADGLYGWGNNKDLTLGVDTGTDTVFEPMCLNIKVKEIATSLKHTFAWNNQEVYGWGSNEKYQLGLDDAKNYPITKLELFK